MLRSIWSLQGLPVKLELQLALLKLSAVGPTLLGSADHALGHIYVSLVVLADLRDDEARVLSTHPAPGTQLQFQRHGALPAPAMGGNRSTLVVDLRAVCILLGTCCITELYPQHIFPLRQSLTTTNCAFDLSQAGLELVILLP